jgi:hypothetical protein
MILGGPSFPAFLFRSSPAVLFALPRGNTRSCACQNTGCYSFGHKIIHRALSSVPMLFHTPLIFNNLRDRCRTLSAAILVFSMTYLTTLVTHRGTPSKSEPLAKPTSDLQTDKRREGPSFRGAQRREPLAVRAFLARKTSLASRPAAKRVPEPSLLRCRSLASLLR